MKWIVLALTIAMYAVVVAVPSKKAWTTLGAALVILLLRVITPMYAFGTLINWSVLMIYIGSLILAELFIFSKVPVRIADVIVEKSPNSGIAIVLILVITGLISAFVENVATVLVMAPIALALSKKLKMNPTLFMIGLAVMANLEGTALLVGDPPSMIFASHVGYGFNEFIIVNGRPSVFFAVQIGLIAGAVYFYFFFSKNKKEKIIIQREPVVSIIPSVLLILMVVGLAVSSYFHGGISIVSGSLVMFLGITGLLWFAFMHNGKGSRQGLSGAGKLVKALDWETILFLIGIFVVIGALSETGLLEDLAGVLLVLINNNVLLGFVIIILASVIISGFVDNVPYIIAMLPVASSLSAALGTKPELYMFALLIGSCLGGNLTPFGASANVVAVGLLKKENIRLPFSGWLKVGLPFTLITTAAAVLFVWFVWR